MPLLTDWLTGWMGGWMSGWLGWVGLGWLTGLGVCRWYDADATNTIKIPFCVMLSSCSPFGHCLGLGLTVGYLAVGCWLLTAVSVRVRRQEAGCWVLGARCCPLGRQAVIQLVIQPSI